MAIPPLDALIQMIGFGALCFGAAFGVGMLVIRLSDFLWLRSLKHATLVLKNKVEWKGMDEHVRHRRAVEERTLQDMEAL